MNDSTLFQSLLAVQKALQTVAKNKKGFKGSYADIEAIWEASRKVINEHGFVVIHTVVPEGVQTTALHESGKKISSVIPLSNSTDPQERGKEITYARRYNLNAIFNIIVADEDNDGKVTPSEFKPPKVDKSVLQKLRAAKTLEELQVFWKALSKDERGDPEIEAVKDEMKLLLDPEK